MQELQPSYNLNRSRTFFVVVVVIFMITFNFLSYFIAYNNLFEGSQVTGGVISVYSNFALSVPITFFNIVFLGIFRLFYFIWKTRPKRGQAALEFIMTYGWAILVVTIFVVSLFYINSVNVKKSPSGYGCFLFTGMFCEEHKVDTSGISLVVRNSLGEDLSYLEIVVLGMDGYCANLSLNLSLPLANGNKVRLNASCLNAPKANSIFRSDLSIRYQISGKSISHQEKGFLFARVEPPILLSANGTCSDGTPINSCSVNKPRYCNTAAQLIDNCNICSCGSGLLCNGVTGLCYSTNYCPDGTQYQACSGVAPVYCTAIGTFSNNCTVCGCPVSYSNCQASSGKCYDIIANGSRLYLTNTFSDIYPSKTLVYVYSDTSNKVVYLNLSKSISLVSAVMNVVGEKYVSFRTNAVSEGFGDETWVALDSYRSGSSVIQNGTLRGYGFFGNSTFNASTTYSNACDNAVFYSGFDTLGGHKIYLQAIGSGTYAFIDRNDDGICANDPVYKFGHANYLSAVTTQGPVEPYASANQETSIYPSDVKIDLGGEGTDEFSKTGIYSGTTQFDFRSALSSYIIGSCSSSSCQVPLVVKSSTAGQVTLKDISITYY